MKICCLVVLGVLTITNSIWQHRYYTVQIEALEGELQACKAKPPPPLQVPDCERCEHDLRVEQQGLSDCRKELDSVHTELRDNFRISDGTVNRFSAERDDLIAERDGLARDLRACRDDFEGVKGSKTVNASASSRETLNCARRLTWAVSNLRRLKRQAQDRELEAQASLARLSVGSQTLKARFQQIKDGIARRLAILEAKLGASLDMHAEQASKIAADLGFEVDLGELRKAAARDLEYALEKEQIKANESNEKTSWQQLYEHLQGKAQVPAIGSATPSLIRKIPAPVANDQEPCVVAVVPFRGRGIHLEIFFNHIRRFVQAESNSQKCWSFYIVEQYNTGLFNRGWLFNVGYAMAKLEHRQFSCIAIQDLDTLPELGSSVDYADCPSPTQMSSEIECYGWLPPYAGNAGGVVTMSGEHWETINGFSNEYEGWGGEDDDLKHRLDFRGLLRGTCEPFCNLSDRAFAYGQTNLIHRPPIGKGRFICLDEKSHTARKHGDMKKMNDMLKDMESGSNRWEFDGLSSLKFELVRHYSTSFPNTSANATLHWIKAVPADAEHVGPERLRIVLADSICREECRIARRCSGFPSQMPFSFSELQAEVGHVFRDCLVKGQADDLGYWLIDRNIVTTALHNIPELGGGARAGALGWDRYGAASWALNEVMREAMDQFPDGDPALVARAVPIASLSKTLREMRNDPARQQPALVSVCVGVYRLDDYRLGIKHIVNVGSDDCEQRSWTHLTSFKALRHPRSPRDFPICTAEAAGTWTWKIGKSANCSGDEFGPHWEHRDVFYVGEDASGSLMCVMSKKERQTEWSRWAVMPADDDGSCGPIEYDDEYVTEFTFRSMEDSYLPPRIYLCASISEGRLRLDLGCNPRSTEQGVAYPVLNATRTRLPDEIFCIGRHRTGDRIAKGGDCSAEILGAGWSHIDTFSVPANATGRPWCMGARKFNKAAETAEYRVAAHTSCSSISRGRKFEHVLGFREVALADIDEEMATLSLMSVPS